MSDARYDRRSINAYVVVASTCATEGTVDVTAAELVVKDTETVSCPAGFVDVTKIGITVGIRITVSDGALSSVTWSAALTCGLPIVQIEATIETRLCGWTHVGLPELLELEVVEESGRTYCDFSPSPF